MAVAITDTEVNPTYVEGHGGGLKALTEIEINPTFYAEYPPTGWQGKIAGVTNPASIMGVDVANIASVNGVASA